MTALQAIPPLPCRIAHLLQEVGQERKGLAPDDLVLIRDAGGQIRDVAVHLRSSGLGEGEVLT